MVLTAFRGVSVAKKFTCVQEVIRVLFPFVHQNISMFIASAALSLRSIALCDDVSRHLPRESLITFLVVSFGRVCVRVRLSVAVCISGVVVSTVKSGQKSPSRSQAARISTVSMSKHTVRHGVALFNRGLQCALAWCDPLACAAIYHANACRVVCACVCVCVCVCQGQCALLEWLFQQRSWTRNFHHEVKLLGFLL